MKDQTINDAVTRAGGEGALLTGRYRVVRQLGQGGMGSVWLAEDTQLDNKPFAIKMLPSILVSNKRAYRQLKDEALVAMKLTHPNIVTLRAFEENNGNPFLVMDYIDGQTLDDYLAEHALAPLSSAQVGEAASRRFTGTTGILPVDVLRILRPIAVALDYAHTKGVVHRDVKPGNVMIAKDGTPYILDFGIAREIQETMTRVTGKLSSGTLLYMSPEQLNGERPTPAQDIYSFAAMVYECLKGEPPFSHGQIEFQIINKQPEPLTGKAAILAAGVMAGLAKKPEDRPATCTAVLEENNLAQRRREAEAQSGRARSPSAPQPNAPRLPQGGALHDHKGVQLWENGPYWAETNIGAEKPEDYGYYFWWGDTVGYKREDNTLVGSEATYDDILTCSQTAGENIVTLQSEGWITVDKILSSGHDAAQVQWGNGWRMPTRKELDNLICKCDWIWTKMNGINGYVVHGRGNYASANIFLPAAGEVLLLTRHDVGASAEGYYWSSVPPDPILDEGVDDEGVDTDLIEVDEDSWCLHFSYLGKRGTECSCRDEGLPVRPVRGITK